MNENEQHLESRQRAKKGTLILCSHRPGTQGASTGSDPSHGEISVWKESVLCDTFVEEFHVFVTQRAIELFETDTVLLIGDNHDVGIWCMFAVISEPTTSLYHCVPGVTCRLTSTTNLTSVNSGHALQVMINALSDSFPVDSQTKKEFAPKLVVLSELPDDESDLELEKVSPGTEFTTHPIVLYLSAIRGLAAFRHLLPHTPKLLHIVEWLQVLHGLESDKLHDRSWCEDRVNRGCYDVLDEYLDPECTMKADDRFDLVSTAVALGRRTTIWHKWHYGRGSPVRTHARGEGITDVQLGSDTLVMEILSAVRWFGEHRHSDLACLVWCFQGGLSTLELCKIGRPDLGHREFFEALAGEYAQAIPSSTSQESSSSSFGQQKPLHVTLPSSDERTCECKSRTILPICRHVIRALAEAVSKGELEVKVDSGPATYLQDCRSARNADRLERTILLCDLLVDDNWGRAATQAEYVDHDWVPPQSTWQWLCQSTVALKSLPTSQLLPKFTPESAPARSGGSDGHAAQFEVNDAQASSAGSLPPPPSSQGQDFIMFDIDEPAEVEVQLGAEPPSSPLLSAQIVRNYPFEMRFQIEDEWDPSQETQPSQEPSHNVDLQTYLRGLPFFDVRSSANSAKCHETCRNCCFLNVSYVALVHCRQFIKGVRRRLEHGETVPRSLLELLSPALEQHQMTHRLLDVAMELYSFENWSRGSTGSAVHALMCIARSVFSEEEVYSGIQNQEWCCLCEASSGASASTHPLQDEGFINLGVDSRSPSSLYWLMKEACHSSWSPSERGMCLRCRRVSRTVIRRIPIFGKRMVVIHLERLDQGSTAVTGVEYLSPDAEIYLRLDAVILYTPAGGGHYIVTARLQDGWRVFNNDDIPRRLKNFEKPWRVSSAQTEYFVDHFVYSRVDQRTWFTESV